MAMLDALHAIYPTVLITLHAGEVVAGLAPPDALRSHIHDAIETGHAVRIGHGVDVLGEDDAADLLREMASSRILVEIALTSNDLILGVRGPQHPLSKYIAAGVPVAIATDDEGVSRSSHTQEFLKAVEDQDLDYRMLKRMARNSLDYAFVDAETKGRLRSKLEADFLAFERRQ
jgi:adenosine deaminase